MLEDNVSRLFSNQIKKIPLLETQKDF